MKMTGRVTWLVSVMDAPRQVNAVQSSSVCMHNQLLHLACTHTPIWQWGIIQTANSDEEIPFRKKQNKKRCACRCMTLVSIKTARVIVTEGQCSAARATWTELYTDQQSLQLLVLIKKGIICERLFKQKTCAQQAEAYQVWTSSRTSSRRYCRHNVLLT